MNFTGDFLTQQIIAYIGNKRKLLDLIYRAIEQTGLEIKPGLKFLDVFAGSGVVSRLAKSLNFEVFTNDWEYYSYILSNCYLKTNQNDIEKLFGSQENFQALLDSINSLPEPPESEQYIAKYYAPKETDIDSVDYRTERLFYTRQNALAIDKIRNYIEEKYPLNDISDTDLQKRNLLLAELIYEAATHNNTSGVFKACHKGFGGHSKDALTRILGKIELHQPVLINSDFPVHITQKDANELVQETEAVDIAYLDPPYNQHQYGSNYHLLNTIAKWDHLPAPLELNENGVLKEKAAIRHDWINTRSPYCYRENAVESFKELIENLKASHILISYSTDGIIPFEEMKKICMKKGKVSIVTNEYTTYRGGKQSNKRQNTNIEFILCINTNEKSTEETEKQLSAIVIRKKSLLLFKQRYCKSKLISQAWKVKENELIFKIQNEKISVNTNSLFTLELHENFNGLDTYILKELNEKLEKSVCENKEEELSEILAKLSPGSSTNAAFMKLIPDTLKKLAHKKNRLLFYKWLKKVKNLQKKYAECYSLIEDKINQLELLAEVRFNS